MFFQTGRVRARTCVRVCVFVYAPHNCLQKAHVHVCEHLHVLQRRTASPSDSSVALISVRVSLRLNDLLRPDNGAHDLIQFDSIRNIR